MSNKPRLTIRGRPTFVLGRSAGQDRAWSLSLWSLDLDLYNEGTDTTTIIDAWAFVKWKEGKVKKAVELRDATTFNDITLVDGYSLKYLVVRPGEKANLSGGIYLSSKLVGEHLLPVAWTPVECELLIKHVGAMRPMRYTVRAQAP